jgi:hypothetical protein
MEEVAHLQGLNPFTRMRDTLKSGYPKEFCESYLIKVFMQYKINSL